MGWEDDYARECEQRNAREAAQQRRALARFRELTNQMVEECGVLWRRPEWGMLRDGDVLLGEIEAAFNNRYPSWRQETPAPKSAYRRKNIGSRVRLKVYERDGYACVTCGTHEKLTIDHIHPVSKGGTNDMDNLQTMCHSCNARKGARTVEGGA